MALAILFIVGILLNLEVSISFTPAKLLLNPPPTVLGNAELGILAGLKLLAELLNCSLGGWN